MKKWIPLLFLVLISSCIKDESAPNPGTGIVTTPVPASFDWNMIKTVNIQVAGMPTDIPTHNSLKVSDKAGTVYLNKWTLMSDNGTLSVSVPARTDSLVVSYGSISKTLKVDDGPMNFSYVTPRPNPESSIDLGAEQSQ